MKYVIFTFSFEGAPIAKRLQDEGNEVALAVIEDNQDMLTSKEKGKPEEPEDKKKRMATFDGMVKKMTAKQAVKMLEKAPKEERQNYFLFFDLNHCFKYAEMLSGKGFCGNFPTEEDRLMEVDRNLAKEFVEKNYPNLKVAEVEEFTTAQEGIDFLNETEDRWVLKGLDEDAKTVVPDAEDVDQAKNQIIEKLTSDAKMYEKSGYILERMIPKVVEFTPEIHFYNGKPLCTMMDLELKRMGGGDVGYMTGCAADLCFETEPDSDINACAFPKAVFDLAKKHEGWFVWDASILIDPKTGDNYFGEFCSNRVGYNAFYTELANLPRISDFFEAVMKGENPFQNKEAKFSSSVRVFNLRPDGKPLPEGELVECTDEDEAHTWLMDVKNEQDEEGEDKYVSCCYMSDLAVITGTGDTIEETAKDMYMRVKRFSFAGKYTRPQHDFLSKEYNGSIPNRYMYGVKHDLF